MKFKENLDLIFRKNKVIKVYVFMPDRRTRVFVREIDGLENGDFLDILDGAYIVLHDYVYFENGLAKLYYKYENPSPLDMSHNRVEIGRTAKEIMTTLNTKVFHNIVAESKDKTPNSILIMISIALLLVMIGGFYYMNEQIVLLQESNDAYKQILESLRDSILNSEVN